MSALVHTCYKVAELTDAWLIYVQLKFTKARTDEVMRADELYIATNGIHAVQYLTSTMFG